MDDVARKRLRKKQDRLIELANIVGLPDSLQLGIYYPGSPQIHELRSYLFPEFEAAIDDAVAHLECQKGDRQ